MSVHGAIRRRIDHAWFVPLGYFSFQLVLHDWQWYAIFCGMVHIKEPLLLIGKSSTCGGRGGGVFSR